MTDPVAFVERMYEALNEDDDGPFLALCAPDVVVEYPAHGRLPYGGTWRGRDGVAAFLDAHDEAEEILAFEVQETFVRGDRAIVLGHFEGRAKPGGRAWSTAFVHVLTVRGQQLHRWQAFFDTAAAVEAHSAS